MRSRLYTWILCLLVAAPCSQAQGAGILRKPARPDPAEHVATLIRTLSTDPDERKRANAAEDLRDYDAKVYPEMIPVLIEALKNDPSTSVRLEAVSTIGKMRPISASAGYALEQAVQHDTALRVRAVAKTTLVHWTLFLGYQQGRMVDPLQNQTGEPPLATPLPGPIPKMGPSAVLPNPANLPGVNVEPPARPVPPLMPSLNSPSQKPDRFIPRLMSRLKPEFKPKPKEDGPTLPPPM